MVVRQRCRHVVESFVVKSLVDRSVDLSPLVVVVVVAVVVVEMMMKLTYVGVRLRAGRVRRKVDPQGQLEELDRHLDISLIQLQRQKKLPCQVRGGSLVLQLCRLVDVEFLSSSEEVPCLLVQLLEVV